MMIEGGGRWGYDDIWIKLKKEEKKEKKPKKEKKVETPIEKIEPEEGHKPVADNEAQAND